MSTANIVSIEDVGAKTEAIGEVVGAAVGAAIGGPVGLEIGEMAGKGWRKRRGHRHV